MKKPQGEIHSWFIYKLMLVHNFGSKSFKWEKIYQVDNENSISSRQAYPTDPDVYLPMMFRTSFDGPDLFACTFLGRCSTLINITPLSWASY